MASVKVLFVSHSSWINGAENSLLTLVRYLDKEKYEPVVVIPEDGLLKKKLASYGIKTYECEIEWWVNHNDATDSAKTCVSARLDRLKNIIAVEQPAIVHTNSSVIWEGALAAALSGIPHIWHIHENLEDNACIQPVFPLDFLFKIINDLSDKVIAVSSSVEAGLRRHVADSKLATVYNGVDNKVFTNGSYCRSLRDEYSLPSNTFLITTLASLIPEKGIDLLVGAARIIKRSDLPIRFIIVGHAQPEVAYAFRLKLSEYGLTEHVLILGFSEEVPFILSQTDLLL